MSQGDDGLAPLVDIEPLGIPKHSRSVTFGLLCWGQSAERVWQSGQEVEGEIWRREDGW